MDAAKRKIIVLKDDQMYRGNPCGVSKYLFPNPFGIRVAKAVPDKVKALVVVESAPGLYRQVIADNLSLSIL
ncbi:MAG: hypothetical protein EBR27_12275 [Betaproteobacteria bacterium]|nr:hypothetical protein [Betaproteobacteria bacterium]